MGLLLIAAAILASAAFCGCWLVKSNGDLDPPPDVSEGGAEGGAVDAHFATACDAGNILCEDFEHGLSSFWSQDTYPPDSSTVVVETTKAEHGTHSLHAHVDMVGTNLAGPPAATIGVDQGSAVTLPMPFWVRFFVWAEAGGLLETRPDDSAVATLYQRDANMDIIEVRASGAAMAKTFAIANTADNSLATSMTPFPLASWHCLEWQVTQTGLTLWLDGMQLKDLNATTKPLPVSFEEFGWASDAFNPFTSMVGQDVWIDEIIISTQRVGCTTFQE